MENKEKQVRKIAQRVMTKYKLHPPVDMMGLIQEKGITCVEENLGTNADGYSDLKDSDLKIVLNSAIQYEPRKRFTLAHELGHIFISWHSDVTLCVKAIRQIFQWYIEEGYGGSKIANMLNERGIKTKRGNNWSQNAVCRILTNEIYTGKIINGKEEIADFLTGQRKEKDESEWLVTIRPELRIIEEEVFDKAQDILKGRHDSFKITHERQSNKYLFSTLIKCKECGWSFRRTVRQYKNTYVRWVCSGHNGKGADSCPNAVTVDEEELIQALQEYFQEILSKKKKVINYVIKEFQRVYKAKDENIEYEKQLNAELNKLHKSREKYMDMYTDDLISREELNEKIGGMRKEIERLENELKMVSYHLTKGEQLEAILNSTFKQLEDITDVHEMTNAQLKRLINKIEVDKDGNVDIYLHLIGDLGLDETVLIEGDKNTEEKGTKKVPNSYNHT